MEFQEGRKVTYKANVNTGDSDTAKVFDAGDHLIDDFRAVCLCAEQHFKVVCPTLCFPESALVSSSREVQKHA